MWAETTNARGGIPFANRTFLVELVVVDCGHVNVAREAELTRNITRDMVNGVYGRIDFIVPAFSTAHAINALMYRFLPPLLPYLAFSYTDPARIPVVGNWGDSSVLRCTEPLPAQCTKVGDARWKCESSSISHVLIPVRFGGVTVNPATENFLAGFFSLAKLKGAKTAAILYEDFPFSANTSEP